MRYRVRSRDGSFCRAATVRCTAQLSEASRDATYAALYEPFPTAGHPDPQAPSRVLFSSGAQFGDGRRVVLPAGGFVAEVLAQTADWQTLGSDALLMLHPIDRLWNPAQCGAAVAVGDGVVVSNKGCAAAALAPTGIRLWLPPPQTLHGRVARFLVGRSDSTLPMAIVRTPGRSATIGTELVIGGGAYRFDVLRSEAVLPP